MTGMLVFGLRRDRLTLAIWILGIVVLLASSAAAVGSEFGDEESRAQVLRIALATPSLLALRGVPNGPSLGSVVFFQVFTFLAVGVGLMNTFFATRHGRAEEESGRRELIAAGPLHRSTPLLSTLGLGVSANVVLGLLAAGGFAAGGLGGPGAWLAGAALGLTGVAFLGSGALIGELVPTSRAANGISAAVVLLAYALRGAGDALGTPDLSRLQLVPAWPSWLSPIGWGQKTLAFTANNTWPLLLLVGLAAVTMAVALAVHARRDLGASVLPERPGRSQARRSLRSSFGLTWRLHWPSMAGWTLGSALLGLATGSLASAVSSTGSENLQIETILKSLAPGGSEEIMMIFISAIMMLIGMLAAVAGLQGVLRLREEEVQQRAELVLASSVSRRRWLLEGTAVGALAAAIVMAATGVAAWLSLAATGEAGVGWRALVQASLELPAAMIFVGVGALLVTVLPSVAAALTWAWFAIAAILGLFGGILQLPSWLQKVSPFAHVPSVPVVRWSPVLIMIGISIAMVAVAAWRVRRRELRS